MAARAVGIAVAGLALASNAFMIPSNMVLDGEQMAQVEAVDRAPAQQTGVILDLACPECGQSKDVPGESLLLDFTLSDDRRSLELWGRPFYPRPQELAVYTDPPDNGHKPLPIFYHTSVHSTPAADGVDEQLIDIDFQITGLTETDVTVDKVALRLLYGDKTGFTYVDAVIVPAERFAVEDMPIIDGEPDELEFTILPFDPVTPPHPLTGSRPPHPHDDEELKKAHEQPECHGPAMLCRLKSIVEDRISMMRETIGKQMSAHGPRPHGKKPCPGMMMRPAHGAPAVPIKGGPAKFWGMGHPHPHHRGGHHGHKHHHHGPMHRLAHAAQRLFFGFALPVMIGIAAGMTASVLGMIVGTCVAWLWIKLVRGGRRGAAPTSASAQEAGEATEKAGLMSESALADDEALPEYVEKA